jgi:hypothetical protein
VAALEWSFGDGRSTSRKIFGGPQLLTLGIVSSKPMSKALFGKTFLFLNLLLFMHHFLKKSTSKRLNFFHFYITSFTFLLLFK